MSGKTFKVGDRVRCLEGFPGWLVAGETYTIAKLSATHLVVEGDGTSWTHERFELVEPEPTIRERDGVRYVEHTAYLAGNEQRVIAKAGDLVTVSRPERTPEQRRRDEFIEIARRAYERVMETSYDWPNMRNTNAVLDAIYEEWGAACGVEVTEVDR